MLRSSPGHPNALPAINPTSPRFAAVPPVVTGLACGSVSTSQVQHVTDLAAKMCIFTCTHTTKLPQGVQESSLIGKGLSHHKSFEGVADVIVGTEQYHEKIRVS